MFWLSCGVPSALMIWVAVRIVRVQRKELRSPLAWPAWLFTAASTFAGILGLILLERLSKRSGFDYGYEGTAWLLGAIGFVFSIGWLAHSRSRVALTTFGVAIWMSLLWTLVCSTL